MTAKDPAVKAAIAEKLAEMDRLEVTLYTKPGAKPVTGTLRSTSDSKNFVVLAEEDYYYLFSLDEVFELWTGSQTIYLYDLSTKDYEMVVTLTAVEGDSFWGETRQEIYKRRIKNHSMAHEAEVWFDDIVNMAETWRNNLTRQDE